MKVRALVSRKVSFGKRTWDLEAGKIYDLPDAVAKKTIEQNVCKAEPDAAPPTELLPELEVGGGEGGVDVGDFIDKARAGGSVWIRTSELKKGDEFEVLDPGEVDTETFDRPYLCILVRYQDLERRLRVGAQNAERIAGKLGKSSADWVGRKIRVLTLEDCPQLTKRRGIETRRAVLEGVA